jgi:hypothetical protein
MADKLFEDSDLLKRNDEDVMFSEVDGESVIMHMQSGRYFGLNSVSTDIWNHLENKVSFSELIEFLMKEYEVNKEQCTNETRNIINALLKLKFLAIQD